MNRRNLIACAGTVAITVAAKSKAEEISPFQYALERICLLDDADGHELTWETASAAVGIASQALGKHPAQVFAERYARNKPNR